MNARQKCKKLKQELDFLKGLPVTPIINTSRPRVEVFRAVQRCDAEYFSIIPEQYVLDEIRRVLCSDVSKHIAIKREIDETTGVEVMIGEIKIVMED